MGEIMEKEKRIDLQIYVYADNLFLGLFDSKILSDKTIQAIKKDVEKHFEKTPGRTHD